MLAPMFDVVTTSIYRYTRLQGGEDLEDRTTALKLFAGKGQTRTYPTTAELTRFGREICRVHNPKGALCRIAYAMTDTLSAAEQDGRIPSGMLAKITGVWSSGMNCDTEACRIDKAVQQTR